MFRAIERCFLWMSLFVTVVNKEFYRQIAELFTELCGGKRYNGKNDVQYPGILKLPAGDHSTKQAFAGDGLYTWSGGEIYFECATERPYKVTDYGV